MPFAVDNHIDKELEVFQVPETVDSMSVVAESRDLGGQSSGLLEDWAGEGPVRFAAKETL